MNPPPPHPVSFQCFPIHIYPLPHSSSWPVQACSLSHPLSSCAASGFCLNAAGCSADVMQTPNGVMCRMAWPAATPCPSHSCRRLKLAEAAAKVGEAKLTGHKLALGGCKGSSRNSQTSSGWWMTFDCQRTSSK